jgi:hypothetical protein
MKERLSENLEAWSLLTEPLDKSPPFVSSLHHFSMLLVKALSFEDQEATEFRVTKKNYYKGCLFALKI